MVRPFAGLGIALSSARASSAAPGDCVVVEDSFVGVSAGIATNMTVFGLSATEDDKSVAAANKVFASLDEIHEYFVSQNQSRK